MREVHIRRVAMVSWVLASVGPLMWAIRSFQASARARSLTQFGPLPEWPITWIDWVMLASGLLLIVATVLEAVRVRMAVLVSLVAVLALWRFYGPGVWSHITGETFFEPVPGHATVVPWQQVVYQVAATGSALALAWLRRRPRRIVLADEK